MEVIGWLQGKVSGSMKFIGYKGGSLVAMQSQRSLTSGYGCCGN
jgi:hypothetical protein